MEENFFINVFSWSWASTKTRITLSLSVFILGGTREQSVVVGFYIGRRICSLFFCYCSCFALFPIAYYLICSITIIDVFKHIHTRTMFFVYLLRIIYEFALFCWYVLLATEEDIDREWLTIVRFVTNRVA